MQIKKEEFLQLCYKVEELNHKSGRYNKLKEKARKKNTSMKFYDRTFFKLDKFCKENNLTRNQVLESLIELLPYIDMM